MGDAYDSRINRALGIVKRETLEASHKYSKVNAQHTAVDWVKVIQKQLGDTIGAIKQEDAEAVAKELSQIAAAATLALVHLVEDL